MNKKELLSCLTNQKNISVGPKAKHKAYPETEMKFSLAGTIASATANSPNTQPRKRYKRFTPRPPHIPI